VFAAIFTLFPSAKELITTVPLDEKQYLPCDVARFEKVFISLELIL